MKNKREWEDNAVLRKLLDERMLQLKKSEDDLRTLTDNLPGGILRCTFDKKLTITYVSDGFVEMFGYTRGEIHDLFGDSFWEMLYPDDREPILESVISQMEKGNTKQIEYRVARKDGRIVWILDRGQLVKDEAGVESFNCILLDVTETKKVQEELRLSLERHKIIMNQTSDIIFEWDIGKDTVLYSSNWEKTFSFRPITEKFSEKLPRSQHVHPDDRCLLTRSLENLLAGTEYLEIEFRMMKGKDRDSYLWCRARSTLQFDAAGRPVKAVGVIINIDREKKRTQVLVEKAERDALTGLYNKATMQNSVESLLALNQDNLNAFMIIDIDNFKNVNDSYGHLYGDAILTDIARGIQRLFRSSDVIGRIGGDEFAVYLTNMIDREAVAKKAEDILKIFRNLLEETDNAFSCSIGITLSPDDGTTYQTLYKNADLALYQAKKQGKNGYAFYRSDIASMCLALPERSPLDSEQDGIEPTFRDKLSEYVFNLFYQSHDILTAIPHIMEFIGKRYDVSRVYIFENSEDDTHISNTFEWCNEGVSPEIEYLQDLSLAYYQGYYDNFDEDGVFYCRDICKLPPSHVEILEKQGVKSLLQCAVMDKGKYRGFIGFDECRKNRLWTQEQIDALTFAAQIIGTFLLKERANRDAMLTVKCMEDVLNQQNAWIYIIDLNTYELLYINSTTRALLPDIEPGQLCYRKFYGKEEPCKNCPAIAARGKNNYSQRMYSRVLERDFIADVSFLAWKGCRNACVISGREVPRKEKKG